VKNFIKENRITGADVERIYKEVEEESKKGAFFVDISQKKGDCPHNDIIPVVAEFFKNAANGKIDKEKHKKDLEKAKLLCEGLI
jgi:hypothetical protein